MASNGPSLTMSMVSATGTATSAPSMTMAMSTATSSIVVNSSMGGMGMGMGDSDPHACKISMLWNWYTIDSCFLSRTWHIRSSGAFAGSCIGVILLVVSLELLRRAQREYDRYISNQNTSKHGNAALVGGGPGDIASSDDVGKTHRPTDTVGLMHGNAKMVNFRPSLLQQAVRSLLFMLQFAVGYFVMLLA
ncbi:MAG: Copper Transporter integral membrane protein that functions in high affinity copper transport, partial [Pleopsidium flavum]